MIRQFFVVDKSGVCLYKYARADEEQEINPQLLSCLTTALLQFSEATLMDQVQTLSLANGLMVLTRDGEATSGRYAVGLYDTGDHSIPAKRLNRTLLEAFNQQNPHVQGELPRIRQFDPKRHFNLQARVIPRVLPRTWALGVVWAIAVGLLVSLVVLTQPRFLEVWRSALVQSRFTNDLYAYAAFLFYLPGLLTGIVAGTWVRGLVYSSIAELVLQGALLINDWLAGIPFVFGIFDVMGALGMLFGVLSGFASQVLFLQNPPN
ncbi:MAG: hypothetical protein Kow0069_17030 [Promethearchaeota archaeon]